jgi:hypothetical protein
MPIAYSCPHCGKQFSVAEQFAGQTGPCAACGKPMTIPLVQNKFPPQSSTASGFGIAALIVGFLVAAVMCGGVLLALLLPAVQAAREAARRQQGMNHLKQIGLALHNYHDQHGSFPPAVVTDANGKPLYSGRVLLLPYLEQKDLYDQFDLDQAWDSDQNRAISETPVNVFMDPSSADQTPGKTDYFFVTGTGTVFEGDKAFGMAAITDGTSNTVVVVEAKSNGTHWAEPRDIDFSQPMALPPGSHPSGNLVLMGDGSVRTLSKTINPAVIRQLSTKGGGEPPTGF